MPSVSAEVAKRQAQYKKRLRPDGSLMPNPKPKRSFINYVEHDCTGAEDRPVANFKHQLIPTNNEEI